MPENRFELIRWSWFGRGQHSPILCYSKGPMIEYTDNLITWAIDGRKMCCNTTSSHPSIPPR